MPHGGVSFSAGFYIFGAFFLAVAACGVWMMIDTMRPKRRKQKAFKNIPREPLEIYALLGGVYAVLILLIYVLSFTAGAPTVLSMIALPGAPIMIAVELAYLLRVVVPKASKVTAAEEHLKNRPVKNASSSHKAKAKGKAADNVTAAEKITSAKEKK